MLTTAQGLPPTPGEDPRSRTLNSGLHCAYGVECRTLRWIYILDPPRALGQFRPCLRTKPGLQEVRGPSGRDGARLQGLLLCRGPKRHAKYVCSITIMVTIITIAIVFLVANINIKTGGAAAAATPPPAATTTIITTHLAA